MCSRKKTNLFRTVTFRLALWVIVLFGLLSLAGFALVYFHLASEINRQMDRELISNIEEFASTYAERGLAGLQEEFDTEAQADGKARVFFRLLSPSGIQLAASDLSAWPKVKENLSMPNISSNVLKPPVQIFTAQDGSRRTRIATGILNDGMLMQVGQSMSATKSMLKSVRRTFSMVLSFMILVGGVLGVLIARHAMAGVRRVAEAAGGVGRDTLSQRVPLGHEGEEIDALVHAFNDMLDRIDGLVRELKEVSDNVAHDLRSPITRMRGLAETALIHNADMETYQNMAGSVVEDCDRLVEMINTMLDIAHAHSGVMALEKAPVDMREVVRDAIALFLPVAEEKGVSLTFELPAQPLIVIGERDKLQRVVANLVDNAIKFTPGDGKVIVSGGVTNEGSFIRVLDTGIGMGSTEKGRIFERFYRGEKSRATMGNGLGLSLALALTQMHDGAIQVDSAPGEGSVFTVTFPPVGRGFS